MKSSLRKTLLAALVVFSVPFLGGCAAVAVGAGAAGAVAWYKGELKASLTQSVPAVNRATEEAIDELKLFKISAKADELTGSFTLRNAKDEKITIIVEKEGEGVTALRIRVGVFGNEALSRSILDTIKGNL
jgi:hypothetical protein